ncbi:MAG: class IV adenylate cyclase [Acidobacteriota bacterium]|jgi:adenylate cyclase, class 2
MEIEVKVPVEDLAVLRTQVEKLAYPRTRERHFEANTLFDYPDRSLSASGCLIRVRETTDGALLTFKGRVVQHDRYKMRPECETNCDTPQAVKTILQNLGLRAFFRYEKYREEYKSEDVSVCLDELPFGSFLELEGTPEGIERVAAALGLDDKTFEKRSYAAIYAEMRRAAGKPFGDIVFEDEDNADT